MKEAPVRSEPLLLAKTWLETINHVRSWTFDQWARPDLLGPFGQTIDMKQPAEATVIHIHVQRYLNRVDIDVTEEEIDGSVRSHIFKDLYRNGGIDVGRVVYEAKNKCFRRILSRKQTPGYFLTLLEKADKLV